MTAEQPGPGSPGGPTVLRILLGAQLRRLREAKGITREDAGYLIRSSDSKISRMELGRVGFKERDVADLLTLYGITDDHERQALLGLARQANTPGWWHRYSDLLPSWFQAYIGLEEAATLIRTFEVQFVPGLLQTEDYARAVITQGNPGAPTEDVERRVGLRRQRQQLLSRSAPDLPDVVYVEQLTSALYLDKLDDVDAYAAVMNRLDVESAPPRETVEILKGILQET